MAIDYETANYTIRDAATASGIELNTLRSFYGREHFRIVGSDEKKGRGVAAAMTLPDVLCTAVAAPLWRAGAHPSVAFDAGYDFAYRANEIDAAGTARKPSHLFNEGSTVLLLWNSLRKIRIEPMTEALTFRQLFLPGGSDLPATPTVLLLNEVIDNALLALGLDPRDQ